MRDSSIVFYKVWFFIKFALSPGRIDRAGIDRLRPLLQAGKKNQVFEKRAAETRRPHNETRKIVFRAARPRVRSAPP
jgi:hypothetical protein